MPDEQDVIAGILQESVKTTVKDVKKLLMQEEND